MARLLGLGYPAARSSMTWPAPGTRPRSSSPGHDGSARRPYAFSFSGLKTAVARYVESHPDADAADIAAGSRGRSPTC